LRRIVLYVLLLITPSLKGQSLFTGDTILIGEVVIRGKNNLPPAPGNKNLVIDSSIIKNYHHGSVADIISGNSQVFIKSYGTGGTATIAFRGTGASQTQVSWNNININHPMLGQSDLSLIPAGFIDDIQILYGSASLAVNSGGLGGTINLETRPVWLKETSADVNTGSGSFGRLSGLAKIRTGNSRFQSSTRIMLQSAENNFRYLNSETPEGPAWERRKNASAIQKGFMQEFYLKTNKNVASAHLWYQSAVRQIPVSIVADKANAGEKQVDESVRTSLKIRGVSNENEYDISFSAMYGSLNYTNNLAAIYSRNRYSTYILKTGYEMPLGEKTSLSLASNEELNIVNSNNYDSRKGRNLASVSVSLISSPFRRMETTLLARELMFNDKLLVPDFNAGFELNVYKKEYIIKGNISRNSRIPTLNENFWVPGGNPGLKNEYATTWEITSLLDKHISNPLEIKADMTLFFLSVRDMIQWQPGESSFWTPVNIRKVNNAGFETSMNLRYATRLSSVRLNFCYSFTRSVEINDNTGKILSGYQLIYVPEHKLNTLLRFQTGNLYSDWQINITGRRYISVDNSQYLPGFMLNDLIAGYKVTSGSKSADINLKIENIFNTNYQAIAYYPMPGRSYFVSLIFHFKN
jgi:iron complex outermembrane receptor protein